MKAAKNCYLFTQSYPYGNGEVFVGRELKYLSAFFEQVTIFPFSKSEDHHTKMPANVSVVNLFEGERGQIKPTFRNKLNALVLAIKELSKDPEAKSNFRWNTSLISQQLVRAEVLKQYIKKKDTTTTVFYTYWFDAWALILSLMKERDPEMKFRYYSRAHGFDIFRDQTRAGYHPFKSLMLKHTNGVYSVSKKGAASLKEQYPAYAAKVHQSYLGSEDKGVSGLKEGMFHIVSCAGVRKIKRVDLVPEILKQLPSGFEVKWTLIGDGQMLQEVKEKCMQLGKNITCEFKGNLDNEEVLAFYRNNSVNLFLSVSGSEGVPFTMIEAISFGIPLMATDVGGCSEICTTSTGILIDKDFDTKDAADKIVAFSHSEMNTEVFRKGVKDFWHQHFYAPANYTAFYSEIAGSQNKVRH